MAKIIDGMINGNKVRVNQNEPIDKALRKFKRKINDSGVLMDLRKHEFYEKPTTIRKREKAAAKARLRKRLAKERLPQRPK